MTLMSTDDRYADDVHYRGGCVEALDMLHWASSMLVWNARPPDPRLYGDGWHETWLERLEGANNWIEPWLGHQRRDAYWKHGSVCEDYSAIDVPVYAVGGWVDGYTNAVPRMLEGLSVPRKGLIGPWAHAFPDDALPGPSIGFLQECVRWWDHWLKGIDTGIMDEPMLRAWMQDSAPPRTSYEVREGRWVAEPEWPSANIGTETLELGGGPRSILGVQTCGVEAGVWCAEGGSADLAGDQRVEDAVSLTWDFEPLAEPVEILGHPQAFLELESDRPQALVSVRLCDVAPDGSSLLVTRGVLNLTHRESHEEPEALEPGRRYEITVPLDVIAHSFAAGHRLRVAVSPTYWPWAWPSPEPVTLTVHAGRLELPVREPREEDDGATALRGARALGAARDPGSGGRPRRPLSPQGARDGTRRADLRLGARRVAALPRHRSRLRGHEPLRLLDRRRRSPVGRGAVPRRLRYGPRRLADARRGHELDDLRRGGLPRREHAGRPRERRGRLHALLVVRLPSRPGLAEVASVVALP